MRSKRWLTRPAFTLVCLVVAYGPGFAQGAPQDHTYTSQEIEAGSRLYATECALCHGPNGDAVAGVNLRRGQFRRALSDEDLRRVITTGVPNAGMPGLPLQPAELNAIVAFIRASFDPTATAVKIGDATRGQALFEGKGACLTCHRVNGTGSRVGPDLSDIGAVRTPAVLQQSLLNPTSTMWPINRPVRIVMRDGRTIRGRRLNEDTYTVQLIDEQERLVSLDKSDLVEFELGRNSAMPPAPLTADELADVVGYLVSLRGLP